MFKQRQIIYFKNYFWDFFNVQSEKVKDKIDYVLFLITVAEQIPRKFFKQISGYTGLYVVRIEFESNIYRIFWCFDEENLVVLFNGIQKKSERIPKRELEKALRIKAEYFENKKRKEI